MTALFPRTFIKFVSALATLVIIALCASAAATPIVGSLQDITQSPYGGPLNSIAFKPFAVAQQNGTNTIWPIPSYAPITNGVFAVNLNEGFYYASPVSVSIFGPPVRPIAIFVPNNTNVWQFNQCQNLGNFLSTLGQTNLTFNGNGLAGMWAASGNTIFPSGVTGTLDGWVSTGNQIYPQ